MKKIAFFVLVITISIFSCKNQNEPSTSEKDTLANQDTVNVEITIDSSYLAQPNLKENENYAYISEPIIYDVIIKNPDPTDDWTEECLSHTNRTKLAEILFQKVYDGELIPYDIFTEEKMTIDQVKELEKKYDPYKTIAKIQFEEDWIYDKKNNKFYKIVKSISIGFERKSDGQVYGYQKGFKVYLDDRNKQ